MQARIPLEKQFQKKLISILGIFTYKYSSLQRIPPCLYSVSTYCIELFSWRVSVKRVYRSVWKQSSMINATTVQKVRGQGQQERVMAGTDWALWNQR